MEIEKYKITTTKKGKIYLGLLVVVTIFATGLSEDALTLSVALMLAFFLLSYIIFRINISNIKLHVQFPKEVYANKTFNPVVNIYNKKEKFYAYAIKVSIFEFESMAIFIDKYGYKQLNIDINMVSRGTYNIDYILLSSTFPFGFFEYKQKFKQHRKLVVFPEPKYCHIKTAKHNKEGESNSSKLSNKVAQHGEAFAIREYRAGDLIKHINWKASAKVDDLRTKEMALSVSSTKIVDFDLINIQNIEEKISCIAGVIEKDFELKIPIGFKMGEYFFAPSVNYENRVKILTLLANYKK